jgi:F-type H+-transporting ATPase subunit b
MLIDWFTVGAQALNFLILVWLLKRFLYRPILAAIDAREQRIAQQLADAAAKQLEATRQRDEFQHKNDEFSQHRGALLGQAIDAANAERQRLLDAAHQAAEGVSASRQQALQSEFQALQQTLRSRTQQEVFAIARQALTELASANLNECMVETFTHRLRDMDPSAKALLAQATRGSTAPAVLRSAFDLPPEQRAAIQNAVNEALSADVRLQFQTAPELVAGIELASDGQKVAWNMLDYLGSLERSVGEVLTSQIKRAG